MNMGWRSREGGSSKQRSVKKKPCEGSELSQGFSFAFSLARTDFFKEIRKRQQLLSKLSEGWLQFLDESPDAFGIE